MIQPTTAHQHSSIPAETVELTMKGYATNSVAKFLTNQFGEKAAKEIIDKNKIGTALNGSLLWFKDGDNKIRTGKVVQVDVNTGVVLKEDEELVHQKFAKKHELEFNYKPCLYREYLNVEFAFFPKGIVHGEILALVLSQLVPKIVWLSAQEDSEYSLKAIAGAISEVPIFLFPKSDSHSRWQEAVVGLDPNFVKVSNQLEGVYSQGQSMDLRKNTLQMIQAVECINLLLKQSHENFERTLSQ